MENKIVKLKKYFQKNSDVLMAFVFGSRAAGRVRRVSDWDIAVYFKPENFAETETTKDYPDENKIWSDLIDILETDEVDFVVLNRASPSLVYNVLRIGLPLKIADRKLYLDLLCTVSYEAVDWWDFVYDFYKITERSRSLSLEDKINALRHLQFLGNEFSQFADIQKFTWQDYQNDSFKRKIIERWVENLIMAALDIAKIILASQKREIPQSYKDTLKVFTALVLKFSKKEADSFSDFAKLRNVVTHEYLDIKWEKIKNFLKEAEKLYPEFINKTKKFLK